jgi:hypothetical protein
MDFIKQNAAIQPPATHNISQFATHKPTPGRGGKDDTVDDRYYTSQEYKTLTPGQKQALKQKRDTHDGGSGPTQKRVKFEPNWQKDFKTMNMNISALLAAAAIVPAADRNDPDNESDGDIPPPNALPAGNRANDALTRQKRPKH